MACIVQKYGGSSLSDVSKLKKVAEKIAGVKKQGINVAVVVSAMGKTTDGLVQMAREISGKPPRREMDMLLSTGERITMAYLCMALNEMGLEAVSLTGSQAGIITTHRHNDARVIEIRPFRVQDELAEGKVVIVGGFQGVSYKRDITTLGRGGSDTTAVALAAALQADYCEIYSDVDGVYSTDPFIVDDARHLAEVSYSAMQEISAAGAKVLNAQAVQFAKEKNIAIYARSTFDPGKQTVIRSLAPGVLMGVQAVVSEKSIARIRLFGSGLLARFRKGIDLLEAEQVPIKEVNVATDKDQAKASFVVSLSNTYGWQTIERQLLDILGADVILDKNLGALSLIGEGLNRDNTTLIETLELLQDQNVDVAGVTTTSFRISLLMPLPQIEAAVRACHKRWVTG
ncbi:MAG: aspartate kinase [Desulfobacteraceae bacterium]|nr:aspartate kinase [Desulfobacteraceae bacterium]